MIFLIWCFNPRSHKIWIYIESAVTQKGWHFSFLTTDLELFKFHNKWVFIPYVLSSIFCLWQNRCKKFEWCLGRYLHIRKSISRYRKFICLYHSLLWIMDILPKENTKINYINSILILIICNRHFAHTHNYAQPVLTFRDRQPN